MAYTPINWQTGDIVTAEKLNKMDNGWLVESSSTTYINESITTEDRGDFGMGATSYLNAISDATLTITFNGTEYTCTKGSVGYGATADSMTPDFTTYPFGLVPMGPVLLITKTAGTYTLKVEASSTTAETSTDFQSAVNSFVDTSMMPMECVSGTTTYAEMESAFTAGRIMFFKPYEYIFAINIITSFNMESINFYPTDAGITVSFDENLVFTVTPT